jgi:hypothetical protein
MTRRWITRQPMLMVALLALTLAMRVIVPTGFMPVAEGGMVRIALCSGMGEQTVWLDQAGQVHKDAPAGSPSKDQHDQQPCGFGALALGAGLAQFAVAAAPMPPVEAPLFGAAFTVAIGRGLAAPPPPATGPPLLI